MNTSNMRPIINNIESYQATSYAMERMRKDTPLKIEIHTQTLSIKLTSDLYPELMDSVKSLIKEAIKMTPDKVQKCKEKLEDMLNG